INPNNILAVAGEGNTTTTFSSHASLAYQNSQIYNLIYTHIAGPWTISPYFQYSVVPTNAKLGLTEDSSTTAGALLVSYGINDHWSVGARAEIETEDKGPVTLAYGPDSTAWSLTFTPTYQSGVFFARGEISYVGLDKKAPGLGFGKSFNDD